MGFINQLITGGPLIVAISISTKLDYWPHIYSFIYHQPKFLRTYVRSSFKKSLRGTPVDPIDPMPRASRQVSNSNKRTSKIAAKMRGETSSFSSVSKGLILGLDGTHLDGGIPTPLKNVPNHQPATNRKWLKQNKSEWSGDPTETGGLSYFL